MRLEGGEAVGNGLRPLADRVRMVESFLQAEIAKVVGTEFMAQEARELLTLLEKGVFARLPLFSSRQQDHRTDDRRSQLFQIFLASLHREAEAFDLEQSWSRLKQGGLVCVKTPMPAVPFQIGHYNIAQTGQFLPRQDNSFGVNSFG